MTDAQAVGEARRILDEEQSARDAGRCTEARRQERERVCKHVSDFIEGSPYVTSDGRMWIRKELVRLLEESGVDGEKSLSLKV